MGPADDRLAASASAERGDDGGAGANPTSSPKAREPGARIDRASSGAYDAARTSRAVARSPGTARDSQAAPRSLGAARTSQAKRRARQREEARRTILDATEELMVESNGSDFSIRALGKRAGYSAPTVYHYFGDKDGLIEALLEDRVARLATQLEGVAPSGDAQADLRALLLAYYDFSASHPTFTRLMWTLSRKGESRMPEAMQRVQDCIRQTLDRFGESRPLGVFDREDAGQVLWGLVYGLVSLRITQPDFTPDDSLAARALDALFLGMAELETTPS